MLPLGIEARGDLRFGADDEPVAVAVGRLRTEIHAIDRCDVDARTSSGVIAVPLSMRAEVPRGSGGGTENADALTIGGEAGHGFAWRLCPAPRGAGWLLFGTPLSTAEVTLERAEVAREVTGWHLLRG